jgi:hypothetical protein
MAELKEVNYTFWKLVEAYHIEIPIIQRDYAQGRADSKTENLRLDFVKVLRKALLPNADKLHLNFVYGKVSKKRFVPLDGQQRLTTLYLLHWYLAEKTGKDKTELSNFSYHTRPSSKDFCDALIKKSIPKSKEKTISEQIEDASWFFTYWKKDPTVKAMLNMLDTIQIVFEKDTKEDLALYWENLTEKKTIHFEFLDLKKFNLTDELYVKMNARGKELSPFENFKAWLMEYVDENGIEIKIEDTIEVKDNIKIKDWKHQLDTIWADLFWNNKGDSFSIDEAYMNFFRNMFQIFYVKTKGYDSTKVSELTKSVEKSSFIPNQFYQDLGILDSDNLNEIFKIIQVLVDNEKVIVAIDKVASGSQESIDFFNEVSLFQSFVSSKVTYADKARFYALSQYLLKHNGDKFSKNTFISWMRVVRNLVVNSNINSVEKLVTAMKGIDELIKHDNLYTSLMKRNELTGFKDQIKEEARKARLINSEIITESNFLKFENHDYFRGRIDFLLNIMTQTGNIQNEFIELGNKAAAIFTHKLKDGGDKEYLLERALLTIDDESILNYIMKIPKAKGKWSLIKMANRENKKEILTWRDDFLPNCRTSSLFHLLLESISEKQKIEDELNVLISSRKNQLNDWRYHLVNHIEHFQYCLRGVVRFINNDNIIIYSKRSANTKRRELYSASFYETYRKKREEDKFKIFPFMNFSYSEVKSLSDTACAYIDHFFTKNKVNHYAIDISYEHQEYHIKFFNRHSNKEGEFLIEKEVYNNLMALKSYKFEEKIHAGIPKQTTKVKSEEAVKSCLEAICNTLIEFKTPNA